VKFGARPKLASDEIHSLVQDFNTPGLSKRDLAELYGISISSVYRLYAENSIAVLV